MGLLLQTVLFYNQNQFSDQNQSVDGKTAKIWALWERNSIQSSLNQSADGKMDAVLCHILSQSVDGKTDVLSLQSRKSVDDKTNASFLRRIGCFRPRRSFCVPHFGGFHGCAVPHSFRC